MARRYLRSDMSEDEARFFTLGELTGEENYITGLFKLIGKYDELRELCKADEILNYIPENDKRYKYENRGYSYLGRVLRAKYPTHRHCRKGLKNLSRKWRFRRVLISFYSSEIMSELIDQFTTDPTLMKAYKEYVSRSGNSWQALMPIQYDFISTRYEDRHKDYRVAKGIINSLADIELQV